MMNFDIDGSGDVLLDAFKARIAESLRVELMAVARQQVDAAVQKAVASLEIAIQTQVDHMRTQYVAKVIVEDKREKAK